jgi:hypothetical protein
MAKETQIKLTKTRYRLGCLGVTIIFQSIREEQDGKPDGYLSAAQQC